MNVHSWTPDERAEYDALVSESLTTSKATRERTAHFLDGLSDAEQAQRRWAVEVARSLKETGAASHLKRAEKAANQAAVSYRGEVVAIPRTIGIKTPDASGATVDQQMLFDYIPFDRLEDKAKEYVTNLRANRRNLDTVLRLLDLRTQVPEAATPAEACGKLGTSVDAYLLGQATA